MFSLAVSIPFNSKFYDVKKVPDTHEAVRNTILNCEVYTGQNVVAATRLKWPEAATVCPDGPVLWPDVRQQCPAGITWSQLKSKCPGARLEDRDEHAEYRTLQAFDTLRKTWDINDLMLFYVLGAPCVHRCTKTDSERNILESIQKIRNWQNYAVVFTNIPKHANGEDIDLSEKKQALLNLGTFEFNSGSIGLENIFRCKYIHGNMQCASCSTKGDVTDYCITDGTGTEAGGASAKGAGMMG